MSKWATTNISNCCMQTTVTVYLCDSLYMTLPAHFPLRPQLHGTYGILSLPGSCFCNRCKRLFSWEVAVCHLATAKSGSQGRVNVLSSGGLPKSWCTLERWCLLVQLQTHYLAHLPHVNTHNGVTPMLLYSECEKTAFCATAEKTSRSGN